MTKMLVTLFAVGAAILAVGEFWDGVYKTPILVVGAGLSAIPFVAIGVIGASVMVRSNSENCPKISNPGTRGYGIEPAPGFRRSRRMSG
jgi:hypothetical protein